MHKPSKKESAVLQTLKKQPFFTTKLIFASTLFGYLKKTKIQQKVLDLCNVFFSLRILHPNPDGAEKITWHEIKKLY